MADLPGEGSADSSADSSAGSSEASSEDVEFPVIGAPVVLELANTRYRHGDQVIDFLATPQLAAAWFDASPTACRLARPRRWTASRRGELAALRDAIAEVVNALVDGARPSAAALETVNAAAALNPVVVELAWTQSGPRRQERRADADLCAALLNELALQAIELVCAPSAGDVRRCASADCWMLFLKDHPRRRWCHNSCGHRNRQAAYYRRTHPQPPSPAAEKRSRP